MSAQSGIDGVIAGLWRRIQPVDWSRSIALGILAYLAGYLLIGLVVVIGGSARGDLLSVLVWLGITFYSALNIPVNLSDGGTADYLSQVASLTPAPSVPIIVYYAIPLIVLVVAGGLAGAWILRGRLDPVETGLTVAGFTIGFASMTLIGSFVFVASLQEGVTAQPALGQAALFGVVYPAVFGLLGTAFVQVVDAFRAGR